MKTMKVNSDDTVQDILETEDQFDVTIEARYGEYTIQIIRETGSGFYKVSVVRDDGMLLWEGSCEVMGDETMDGITNKVNWERAE